MAHTFMAHADAKIEEVVPRPAFSAHQRIAVPTIVARQGGRIRGGRGAPTAPRDFAPMKLGQIQVKEP